jgi:hypothetical protein
MMLTVCMWSLQVRDGVESEIAVATRETKRAGRASKSNAATAAAAKLGTVAPGGKYSRFEAEVRSRCCWAGMLAFSERPPLGHLC